MRASTHSIRSTFILLPVAALVAVGLQLGALAGEARADETEDPAEAQPPRLYLSGLAGGAWATVDAEGNATGDGDFSGSNSGLGSAFGGAALGTTLDLGWSDLRLELEGTGGRRFTSRTPATSGTYVTTAKIWTLQGDFWFEYSLDRNFPDTPFIRKLAPFAGGGIGISGFSLHTRGAAASGRSDSVKFAWQAGAGLAYEVAPWLVLETRYQYADLGGPSVELRSGGGARVGALDLDFGTHEVVGGVRFVLDPF